MKQFTKSYIYLSMLIFATLVILSPTFSHYYDTYCWASWSAFSFENSFENIYKSGTDYPPLYHYILYFYGHLMGSVEKIWAKIHFLKFITLFFHFVTGYFLALLIKKDEQNWEKTLISTLFYTLNIAILYNAVVWGQVDIILTCLAFISCYFAYKKKVLLSILFYILAFNFKVQAIIFLPIVGLLLIPEIVKNFSVRNILSWVLVPIFLQLLIVFPFIASGDIRVWLNVVFNSAKTYPVVSMNAYNIWDLLLSGDLQKLSDNTTFINISYKYWGMFIFFILSGIALFPLAKQAFLSIKNKINFKINLTYFFLIGAIIPLVFFYFNTQMHERYSHPAFVFLIAYSIYAKKPMVSIIGSFAYFLNLEGVLSGLQFQNHGVFVFNRSFISVLFLTTIIWLYIDMFLLIKKGNLKNKNA